jgi:hypothetical protein
MQRTIVFGVRIIRKGLCLRSSMRQLACAIVAAVSFYVTASMFSAASAQTTGVGDDGETGLMWKGFDSSITLYRLDPTLTFIAADERYGPYVGYTPIAMTTDAFSDSHVVWSYTDGSISFWTLDASMNYVSSEAFGPYFGWNATGLSADPISGGIRIVWKNINGAVAIWVVDADGTVDTAIALGPPTGDEPATRRRSAVASRRLRVDVSSERYYARGKPPREAAAAAMEAHRKAVLLRQSRSPQRVL